MPKTVTGDEWNFVMRHLWLHTDASCLSVQFHDEFHDRFGGRRKPYIIGAAPVYRAMEILSLLAKDGTLDVRRISLGDNRISGMPRWVYSYSISEQAKGRYRLTGTMAVEKRLADLAILDRNGIAPCGAD